MTNPDLSTGHFNITVASLKNGYNVRVLV